MLATRGIEIVPTLWRERLSVGELLPLFEKLKSDEAVIKPVMGANAQGTWRLDHARAKSQATEIEAYFASRPLMLQPCERSHSILKVPKRGEFRVQQEHGSEIIAVLPEPALRARAVRRRPRLLCRYYLRIPTARRIKINRAAPPTATANRMMPLPAAMPAIPASQ